MEDYNKSMPCYLIPAAQCMQSAVQHSVQENQYCYQMNLLRACDFMHREHVPAKYLAATVKCVRSPT